MSALLELRNVSKIYKSGFFSPKVTNALDDFSLVIDEAKPTITAVVGESGSGKSTLGSLLMGFIEPTLGDVFYMGKNMKALTGPERWQFRQDVQAIFQDPFAAYNPFYTVDHVLTVPIRKFGLASNREEAREKMGDALRRVGLRPEEILGRYPHQLSGGQRQRIIVARAMLLKPKLIVADEPVSMVDASLRATILESIYTLHKEMGVSVLYITHDLTTAYHVSNEIIVLYKGSVMEGGEVASVVKTPHHPYTRLLIDSIPWPDVSLQWGKEPVIKDDGSSPTTSLGCKFASRCPHVMPKCRDAGPPLFAVGEQQASACYLGESSPALQRSELHKVLASA
ncbi:MAG: ABC transporter ATP-binding protein [Chloroflexota bacterium]